MHDYVRFLHFAPDNKAIREEGQPPPRDKTKIWCLMGSEDDPSGGCGYIENIFCIEEIDRDIKYPIEILSTKYMEAANGRRTNLTEYNSIEEYWADPRVEALVKRSYSEGFAFKLNYYGNPDEIDCIKTFKVIGHPDKEFVLSDNLYLEKPPIEWYSFCFNSVIEELKILSSYETAEEAINAQQSSDDLFGERYFPVLKAPKQLEEQMIDICQSFKGHSKTLTDSEYIYIGIRSKSFELCAIKDIYEAGGTILKDKQWDWE